MPCRLRRVRPRVQGAPPDADAQTLIDLYMEHMIPALLSRASHPVVVGKSVADSLDLLGIEGAEAWSDGAIMRYRSRRTLIDIIGNPFVAMFNLVNFRVCRAFGGGFNFRGLFGYETSARVLGSA